MPAFAQARVMVATAVSGTTTYYSFATSLKNMSSASYQLVWTGTPTGTFTVWASNALKPLETDDTDWVQLTLAVAITQPAGSASKDIVDMTDLPFGWVRVKYVNASSSGVVDAYVVCKGL